MPKILNIPKNFDDFLILHLPKKAFYNELKNHLRDIDPEAQDLPVLLADNHDKNKNYRIFFQVPSSILISSVGLYWFFERINLI